MARNRLNALILEDEIPRIDLFVQRLSNMHNLTFTKDVKEAISLLIDRKWDLLCIDHDLGTDLTGYDLAKWLRDHPEYKPATIIVHSMNSVGAKNIVDQLPGALYRPGFWLKK